MDFKGKKQDIINCHKMMECLDPRAASSGTLQLMGAALQAGDFTPQDCADIISAVFDEDRHREDMGMVNAIMSE